VNLKARRFYERCPKTDKNTVYCYLTAQIYNYYYLTTRANIYSETY